MPAKKIYLDRDDENADWLYRNEVRQAELTLHEGLGTIKEPKPEPEGQSEERRKERLLLKQRMDIEAQMQAELEAALDEFGDEALEDIQAEKEPDYDKLALILLALLVPLLTRGAMQAAAERVDEIGIDFDPADIGAMASDWARRYGYELVRGITDSTRKVLQGAVSQYAATPGMTTEQLAAMLEPAFGAARAETIAITEATRAWSGGTAQYRNLLGEVYGLKTRERWYALIDERTCPICGELHMQYDDVWGAEFPDGPPAHPKCRCRTHVEVVEGDGG